MDFSWGEEQKKRYTTILQSASDIVEEVPANRQYWTRKEWYRCAKIGLLGLSVPEHHGGLGLNALTTAHMLEAFGKGCPDTGLVFSVAAHLFACCMPLAEYGSEEQKKRYLPALCTGEYVGANAITEAKAGSDVFALQTRAIREDSCYVLTGTKSYVSNAPLADVFVVYVVTNPAHGYLGVSAFVLEKDTPGLVIEKAFDKMGLTTTPASALTLHECRVPTSNLLGREGQGAQIFQRSMHWERTCLFALYVGLMERQLEQTCMYAQQRQQFGKPIGKQQAIAHRLADMKVRLEASRLLLYRACWLFDQGEPGMMDTALSKLAISEAAVQGGLDAIHIHGSCGIASEYGIERMLRDAIPGTIFSGTSEIQRNIIASELGL